LHSIQMERAIVVEVKMATSVYITLIQHILNLILIASEVVIRVIIIVLHCEKSTLFYVGTMFMWK
jgi:hypothetical protein